MSVNTYAFTTASRLKSFLGISVTTYDTLLETLINAVSDFIENEINRRLKQTAYTGTKIDGSGTHELVLPQWPVSSTATFTLYERTGGSNYGSDVWQEVDSSKYRVDYDAGIIRANFTFLQGFQNYKVDYTAGYAFDVNAGTYLSTLGLSDLELVVWKLAGREFNKRKGAGDIQSMRLYNYSVTFTKEAYSDDEIKEVLSKYQRISF